MHQSNEESLVLPIYRCADKQRFLCDLIAFVFFIKGQCPSFKELESEVKLLLPSKGKAEIGRPNKDSVTRTPAKLQLKSTTRSQITRPTAKFSCHSSPVDRKFEAISKKGPQFPLNFKPFTCYSSPVLTASRPIPILRQGLGYKQPTVTISQPPVFEFVQANDEILHVSFVSNQNESIRIDMPIDVDLSGTFETVVKSSKKAISISTFECLPRSDSILHIHENVHQQRMLRCLAEVVPAVLLAAPACEAIMLAFGQNLVALEQAVLLEFVAPDAEELSDEVDKATAEVDDDKDGRSKAAASSSSSASSDQQHRQVFSSLLGVSGLTDAIPLTSMHVLLRLPRSGDPLAGQTAPPPPFRPRPQFRLRPACRVTRLTLPCPGAVRSEDSMWFHSATPVPGYAALPDSRA